MKVDATRFAEALARNVGGRTLDDAALENVALETAQALNIEPRMLDAFLHTTDVARVLGGRASSLSERLRLRQVATVDAALFQRGIDPVVAAKHASGALKVKPHPPAPTLRWDPSFLQKEAPLDVKGPLSGSPFASLNEAKSAIDEKRGQDSTFLITKTLRGFAVWEYNEKRLGTVDLQELSTKGLPLQSWLVDPRGRTAAMQADGSLKYAPLVDTVVGPSAGLPVVVATKQTNHGENVSFTPKMAFRPSGDIDELAAVLRYVKSHLPKGTKVKAGGSLHSWSKVAASNDVYVHTDNMKGVDLLPARGAKGDVLRADAPRENLVSVKAGTTVREFNKTLWEHFGKAAPCLGGFDGQTLAGVLPTGTHGSVLSHGPLADMIRSMDIVRADGAKVRIERSPGLTDPEAFKREHPGMELIQDDTQFRAHMIHMGTMGIVHSYVLEAVDKFHLKEVRTVTTLDDVKQTLANGGVYQVMQTDAPVRPGARKLGNGHPDRAYHMEILINAHSNKAAITTRDRVQLDREPKGLSERPGRDIIKAIQLGDEFTRPVFPTWMSENFAKLLGFIGTVPLVPSSAKLLVDASIASLKDDVYVQRSYNVFNIGDGANSIPALSSTVFVPLRGDLYLRAVDIIQRTAREFADETGLYQTGPISMRFVKGSDALMAPNEDVCSFELIFAGGTKHAEQMTQRYYEALKRELGKDVTFHWGQLNPGQTKEDVTTAYPGAAQWKRVRAEVDPDRMFLNPAQEETLG